MGEVLGPVEAPGPRQPLVSLPRQPRTGPDGRLNQPVVTVDLELGKRPAGCCICDIPIPEQSTRIVFRVLLREPIVSKGGQRRVTEKYYAHPGCLTDRVRPEVIRTRMDCYDCGAIPEPPPRQRSESQFGVQMGPGLVYHPYRCFTVSKFASAPLCKTCKEKPRWKQCQACQVLFPHWMILDAIVDAVPVKDQDQYGVDWSVLAIGTHQNLCEFCADRLEVDTVQKSREAQENWEALRREIREHGVYEAGEHD